MGSEECIYTITHDGGRAILDALDYAEMRHDLYNREGKQRGNFEHHLALATLQLILTLGLREGQLVEFRAEERNPRACTRVKVKSRVLTIWPDAVAVIDSGAGRTGTGRYTRYLFEIDLTRKNNQRIEDRFAAYAAHVGQHSAGGLAGTQPHRSREECVVVFAVSRESEVERFMKLAGRALSTLRPGERPAFLFWNLEDWIRPTEIATGHRGVLRPPVKILNDTRLATVDGGSRRLVLEGPSR
jgi:hypothetical protein